MRKSRGVGPDDFGLRASAQVRAIEQRIWSLRIAGLGLKWAALPGWGALTFLTLRRTLQTGSLWSLPGLGLLACSAGAGAMLLWGHRALRKEIRKLEAEEFDLL